MKIAFIGGGNMARAIIGGLAAKKTDAEIAVKDPNADKRDALARDFGAQCFEQASDWIAKADMVVLAVKPQVLKSCLQEIAPFISDSATVLSIAAAVPVESIVRWSGKTHVVRCLPNTPAMVGCGFSGLYAGAQADDVDKNRAEAVMKSVGRVLWVEDEDRLHVVTGGPGSGPAYVFLFMEALSSALENAGMSKSEAHELALSTVEGAALLARRSGEDFAKLRENVTSKGGTTAKAVEAFDAGGFRDLVDAAVQACMNRSREMSRLFGAS